MFRICQGDPYYGGERPWYLEKKVSRLIMLYLKRLLRTIFNINILTVHKALACVFSLLEGNGKGAQMCCVVSVLGAENTKWRRIAAQGW